MAAKETNFAGVYEDAITLLKYKTTVGIDEDRDLEPYTSVCSVAHWMRKVGQTCGKRAAADLVALTVAYLSIWILRQPEPKRFSRAWIKYFVGAGPGTFDLRYVMHAKARTLVKRTRVAERLLAACLVDVKANHLVANWALGDNSVKALTSRHLGE